MESFIKNFIYAFGAQVVSLCASLAVTFIVPCLIGVTEFAYWQLFLTYVTYVNITRLGLLDGLYLRLGGKKYEDLDFNLLSQERRVFIVFQAVIAAIIFLWILTLDFEGDRTFVLVACCICMVIVNANNFLSYLLQAVNLTRVYSVSVVLQNTTWFVAVLCILLFKIYSYKVIIIMYILGHVFAGIYLAVHTKEIISHRTAKLILVWDDIKENIKCGIKLMLALYAGNLIISSARMIIDASWGVEIFGYFSFSLTLANVFLTFINQVSIVIFPALRRVKSDKQYEAYYLMRNILSLFLPVVLIGYLPITVIVHYLLPDYEPSLAYLSIFLPICTFDGKMQMMCSTFFKSLRKETTLLVINLCTLASSIVMACIGAFVIKRVEFVAYSILIVIALRSIFSELTLGRLMGNRIGRELVQEIGLVIFFLGLSNYCCVTTNFGVYTITYILYLVINCSRLKNIIKLGTAFR
ncbi:MAG: hypothetical protein HFG49_11805 [Lachnospiraceae bacterium]|jgi:O-antigen/teichoic acid export membrane protein|nr:hypothetical protein [Lachnospiraceae bacterium]